MIPQNMVDNLYVFNCRNNEVMDTLRHLRNDLRNHILHQAQKDTAHLTAKLCCLLSQRILSPNSIQRTLSNILPIPTTSSTISNACCVMKQIPSSVISFVAEEWMHYYSNPENQVSLYPMLHVNFDILILPYKTKTYCIPKGNEQIITYFKQHLSVTSVANLPFKTKSKLFAAIAPSQDFMADIITYQVQKPDNYIISNLLTNEHILNKYLPQILHELIQEYEKHPCTYTDFPETWKDCLNLIQKASNILKTSEQ